MSRPNILAPWFVVLRLREFPAGLVPEWYRDAELEDEQWSLDETTARLFNSIHTATRVARAAGGYAIAIVDDEALKQFRPKGMW